ncbi:MAG: FAD-dependent oxidoreductase [Dehalococcoidia bacterium]
MNEETFDVGIIGAGMLGSAAAYHLAQAGQRVIVLDAGAATAGTTSNSFSWVNAVAKEPETYHALNFAGQREYDRLAADVPAIELHRGGCIQWEADPDSQAALEARVARLQARGYGARWIDPAELAALEPGIRPGEASRFAYYERDLWVDAPAVARSLLASVRERGGEVRERCRVTGFEQGRRCGHHGRPRPDGFGARGVRPAAGATAAVLRENVAYARVVEVIRDLFGLQVVKGRWSQRSAGWRGARPHAGDCRGAAVR